MNTLNYTNFLTLFDTLNHYQAPSLPDDMVMPGRYYHQDLDLMPENFYKAILNEIVEGTIRPIVVSKEFVAKHELQSKTFADKFGDYLGRQHVPFEIAMPFDSVWIEFLSGNENFSPIFPLASMHWGPKAKPQIHGYVVQRMVIKDEPAIAITAFVLVNDDDKIIEACTVSDILPYREYMQMQFGGAGHISMYGKVWHAQLFDIFNLMAQEKQVGIDKAKIKMRIGKGENRTLIKIKDIVYIVPKSERAEFNLKRGTKVDWTHRWEIRGHWRKVNFIGKDPSGRRCVPGLTWVRPSVKGPKDAPLVRKPRVVLASNSGELPQ